jgi:hypothetical protein
MTFHDAGEVEELLGGLEVCYLREREWEGQSAGGVKRGTPSGCWPGDRARPDNERLLAVSCLFLSRYSARGAKVLAETSKT